ncbi:MAG TPA: hypothetical protein VKX96_12430 [Chloroflexota bacterium]|jgi:hypothetical protein|nr:hypothetical protein [Chloroflexota bacterium]
MKPYPEHPDERYVRRPLDPDEIERFLRHESWFVRQECILYQHRFNRITAGQLIWVIENDPHPLNRKLARGLLQEMPRIADPDDDSPGAGPDN